MADIDAVMIFMLLKQLLQFALVKSKSKKLLLLHHAIFAQISYIEANIAH